MEYADANGLSICWAGETMMVPVLAVRVMAKTLLREALITRVLLKVLVTTRPDRGGFYPSFSLLMGNK